MASRLGWLAQVFCLPRKPPQGLSGSGGLLRPGSGAQAMTLPGLTIWVGHRPALIPGEGKYTSPHHLDGKTVTSHGAWVQGSAVPWPSLLPLAGTQGHSIFLLFWTSGRVCHTRHLRPPQSGGTFTHYTNRSTLTHAHTLPHICTHVHTCSHTDPESSL